MYELDLFSDCTRNTVRSVRVDVWFYVTPILCCRLHEWRLLESSTSYWYSHYSQYLSTIQLKCSKRKCAEISVPTVQWWQVCARTTATVPSYTITELCILRTAYCQRYCDGKGKTDKGIHSFITVSVRSTREGNVFTSVCPFTGGGGWRGVSCPLPSGAWSFPWGVPLVRGPLLEEYSSLLGSGRYPSQACTWGGVPLDSKGGTTPPDRTGGTPLSQTYYAADGTPLAATEDVLVHSFIHSFHFISFGNVRVLGNIENDGYRKLAPLASMVR